MGTWGTGLFENDKAVDAVLNLVMVKPKTDLGERLADVGLQVWFGRIDGKAAMKSLQKDTRELTKLPKPVFQALTELTSSPESAKSKSNRSAEVSKITGLYASGWRIDPLLELPNVAPVVERVAEANAVKLDARLTAALTSKRELPQEPLVELGVLTVLTERGIKHSAARVDAWAKGFAALNERTTDDRKFWDEFVTKAQAAFKLLTKH